MRRVAKLPITVAISMFLGCVLSATARAQATWPAGTKRVDFTLPAGWTELPFSKLSPVVTPPTGSGGKCFVTCQIVTEQPIEAYVRLRTELRNASGQFLSSDSMLSDLDTRGLQSGSLTSSNVYSVSSGKSYMFGCQLHHLYTPEYTLVQGRISWMCAKN